MKIKKEFWYLSILYHISSLLSALSDLFFFQSKWCPPLKKEGGEEGRSGLIHVVHTSRLLCMENWLPKRQGRCWILMAPLKCHLTDVTVREILKRARFKDFHLFLIHSHCVLEEDTDHLSLFFLVLMVGLLSARDSEPASVTALKISNRRRVSSVSLKWKSKYRVVFFLLFYFLKT